MTKKSFEKSLEALQDITKKLEEGDLSLEKSIDLYQKGMELAKECHLKLDEAQQKVRQVVIDNGEYKLESFEVEDEAK